jgi:hypothetical protein
MERSGISVRGEAPCWPFIQFYRVFGGCVCRKGAEHYPTSRMTQPKFKLEDLASFAWFLPSVYQMKYAVVKPNALLDFLLKGCFKARLTQK